MFHPLLMVTYGMIAAFTFTYMAIYPISIKIFLLGIVFLLTVLMPGATMYLMMRKGAIHNMELTRRHERVVPYLVFTIGMLGSAVYLQKMMVPLWLIFPFYGTCLALILALIINFFWKISAHAIGVGGFLGGLMGIAHVHLYNPYWMFILLIIISGLVGTARLILKRHTPMQVYAGFCLGFICTFASSLLNYLYLFIK